MTRCQCDWLRVQATSYCDTLFGLFEFCGCVPAYFVPATPLSLNADPGADAELPGGFGGETAWHDWFGWPVTCVVELGLVVARVGVVVGAAGRAVGAACMPPAGAAANAADTASKHVDAMITAGFFMASSF